MENLPGAQSRFVVTVDDAGGLIQDLAQFHRVTEFFGSEGVPASFFVVPRGDGEWQLDREPQWLAALHQAEQQGHDCQLHGLDHHGPEFGPCPPFVYALSGQDPDERLKSDRAQFGKLWRRDLFAAKLRIAIAVFTDALGRRPQVFRSGALSQSAELYQALGDVRMRYVSNQVVDPRGWKYIVGQYDNPGDWDRGVPPVPYRLTESVISLPMASEYAWRLNAEKVEKHLALGLEDLGRVYAAGGVFILICHLQMVGAEEPYARDLLRRLFLAAREEHQVAFQTIGKLVADIESGVLPVIQPERAQESGRDRHGS